MAVQLNKLVSNDSLIQTSKDVEDVAEIVQNIVTNTVNDTEENTEVSCSAMKISKIYKKSVFLVNQLNMNLIETFSFSFCFAGFQ